jgi:RecB family exonuclease
MKYVENVIQSKLSDRNSFFVFPSELVAVFWMRKSLEFGRTHTRVVSEEHDQGKSAILSERFLSWDKFKEKTFSLNMDYSPVNSHVRTLFASSLLEENKKNGKLFKGLIKPEHSSGSSVFLSGLVSILTEVKSFRENTELKDISLGPGVREDLDFLYNAYTKFLSERELFEPSWVKPEITDIGEEYFLFFPEVIEDYKEFSMDLEKTPVVRIIPIENKSLNKIMHFGSSTLELKSLLGKIGSLLDDGVKVQDIAITLPDIDGWRADLASEASLRSIPLDFRLGENLSEYPGAGLFRNILNCEKSGFSISSMKQILLNNAIPWKVKETAVDLLNFGLDHYCFKNYILRGKEIDVWKDALAKSEESLLISFYKDLKSGIKKIASGENFGDIKKAVQKFVSTFLDTDLWSSDTLREFQFCLDTLNDLEDASIKAGNLSYGSGCDIWLSAIDDRVYVKRSETVGVNVFPYRVAGGWGGLWHFIPGLSQTSSAVVKSKFHFLKDNQRDKLPGLETDFTVPFINLYNLSCNNTIFSFSSESFNGPALPPSSFVMEKAVLEIENKLDDEYISELGYWSGENLLPKRIFSCMKKSFDFAFQSAFSPKKLDFTKDPISVPDILNTVLSNLIGDDDYLSVSPSSLDQFISCPYYFLFNRGFSVMEDDYKEVYIDHPVFGQVIHECLDRFFKYVESGFSKSLLPEYKSEINLIIDRIFNRYLATGDAFIPPVWNYCREFTRNKLLSFIDIEADQFPGFMLASAEKKYSHKIIDEKIELTGRIDRVSFKGDKTAIIDYKKNNRLTKSDINSNVPATFQIPFYIYLVEKNGLKVSSASYYNVTKTKYDHVYNPAAKKSWCSEDEIYFLIDMLEKSVRLMNDSIRKGDFSVLPEGCDSCSFRRICRTKYHVR